MLYSYAKNSFKCPCSIAYLIKRQLSIRICICFLYTRSFWMMWYLDQVNAFYLLFQHRESWKIKQGENKSHWFFTASKVARSRFIGTKWIYVHQSYSTSWPLLRPRRLLSMLTQQLTLMFSLLIEQWNSNQAASSTIKPTARIHYLHQS